MQKHFSPDSRGNKGSHSFHASQSSAAAQVHIADSDDDDEDFMGHPNQQQNKKTRASTSAASADSRRKAPRSNVSVGGAAGILTVTGDIRDHFHQVDGQRSQSEPPNTRASTRLLRNPKATVEVDSDSSTNLNSPAWIDAGSGHGAGAGAGSGSSNARRGASARRNATGSLYRISVCSCSSLDCRLQTALYSSSSSSFLGRTTYWFQLLENITFTEPRQSLLVCLHIR